MITINEAKTLAKMLIAHYDVSRIQQNRKLLLSLETWPFFHARHHFVKTRARHVFTRKDRVAHCDSTIEKKGVNCV